MLKHGNFFVILPVVLKKISKDSPPNNYDLYFKNTTKKTKKTVKILEKKTLSLQKNYQNYDANFLHASFM